MGYREPQARQYDLLSWPSLYELRRVFDVTISALCVRLAQFNLNFVDARGHLHPSREQYLGQMALRMR
jgi:hypothetical protein